MRPRSALQPRSPSGVVVNQDVVLHGQLQIRDFLAHPPETEHRAAAGLSLPSGVCVRVCACVLLCKFKN